MPAGDRQEGERQPVIEVLAEIASSISADANVEQMLLRFLEIMMRLSKCKAGVARVLTSDGDHLRMVGSVGLSPALLEKERFVPLGCGICGNAVLSQTTQGDGVLTVCSKQVRHLYFAQQCKTVYAIPLRHKGKVLGVYNLFMDGDETLPPDIGYLFNSISEHLGMALENARLFEDTRRLLAETEQRNRELAIISRVGGALAGQLDPAGVAAWLRAEGLVNVRAAVEAVRHNKLRASLTSLGILFGVASVIAMLAIGKGAEQEILEQIRLLGSNNVVITPVVEQKEELATDQPESQKEIKRFSPGLTYADALAIGRVIPQVDATSGEIVLNTWFTREGLRRSGKVVGVDTTYFRISNLELDRGGWFDSIQVTRGMPVAIIGHGVRTRFFTTEDAIGMIVNGFCKQVFKELPMEFAVEAQKLLSVSLEGSVG